MNKGKTKTKFFQNSLIFFNIKDETRDSRLTLFPLLPPPPPPPSPPHERIRGESGPDSLALPLFTKLPAPQPLVLSEFLIARQNANRRGELKTLSKSWRVLAGEDEI
jgi:hypothetical protein